MLILRDLKDRRVKAFAVLDRSSASYPGEGYKMKKKDRTLKSPVSSKDHVRGSPLAKVTLVGYGDFTCPDCAKSYRAVKKIQAEMGSRPPSVFRSFPQDPLDEQSEGFAEAAESAGAQGKFWAIHDRMF